MNILIKRSFSIQCTLSRARYSAIGILTVHAYKDLADNRPQERDLIKNVEIHPIFAFD